jgi:mannose-6-phosphate isomerase-like protein (cupin superfamily)
VKIQSINLKEKISLISDHWTPKVIAQMNDYHFKIAKIKGEFVWHRHPETDETFIVIEGKLVIELQGSSIELSPGEMCVIPKGIEHRPLAENECQILMIEPVGTRNTGDKITDLTQNELDWI